MTSLPQVQTSRPPRARTGVGAARVVPQPPSASSPHKSGAAMRSRLPPLQTYTGHSSPPMGEGHDPEASLSMSASTRRIMTLAAGFDANPGVREADLAGVASANLSSTYNSAGTATPLVTRQSRLAGVFDSVPLYRSEKLDGTPTHQSRTPTPVHGGRVTPTHHTSRPGAAGLGRTTPLSPTILQSSTDSLRSKAPPQEGADDSDSDDAGNNRVSLFGSRSQVRKLAAARVACGSERRGGAKGTAAERAARHRRLLLASSI